MCLRNLIRIFFENHNFINKVVNKNEETRQILLISYLVSQADRQNKCEVMKFSSTKKYYRYFLL